MVTSMAARAGGGEPEDTEMVTANPFRRETLSLEVVEALVNDHFLTMVLGAIVFISTSSL